ncbi:class II aldolase/adducin family protein [Clostridium sp. 'deep sea']|uniref:class II aldolase/adducin family protein n=1 Tax=Clostridium sp. 'deep sea' TaxID=2779445 RepID=UPI001896923D|nr:class II aldolase/adducin family protein [Clostridium sp. 'deep sea']QOR34998.1 class II aldolase/adducin family protein [Clostridium sp. 'deep sea']
MNTSNGKQEILKYIKLLKEIGLFKNKLGCISLRVDEDNILISPCIENKYFTLDDIKIVSKSNVCKNIATEELEIHRNIYKYRKDINAIIHLFSDYVLQSSCNNENIPPVLEDMAQVIGPTINISNKQALNVVKCLKGRSAVLVNAEGGLCTGKSLHEAYLTCQILEKSCTVFNESKKIGGAKPINNAIAFAMHQVYLRKSNKRKL